MMLALVLEVVPLAPLAVLLIVDVQLAVRSRVANPVLGFSSVLGMLALPPVSQVVGIVAKNTTDAGYITAKRLVATVVVEIVAAQAAIVEQIAVLGVIPAVLTDTIMEMDIDMESTLVVDVAAMETAITKGDFAHVAT